jgi:hypothetical protein
MAVRYVDVNTRSAVYQSQAALIRFARYLRGYVNFPSHFGTYLISQSLSHSSEGRCVRRRRESNVSAGPAELQPTIT